MMTIRPGTLFPGMLAAASAAAPLFVSMRAIASLYLTLPQPIVVGWADIDRLFLSFHMLIFAFAYSLVGIGVLSVVMESLADRWPGARLPSSWAAVGATIGATLVLFDPDRLFGPASFAMVVTAAIGGWLSCRWIEWVEPE